MGDVDSRGEWAKVLPNMISGPFESDARVGLLFFASACFGPVGPRCWEEIPCLTDDGVFDESPLVGAVMIDKLSGAVWSVLLVERLAASYCSCLVSESVEAERPRGGVVGDTCADR